MAGRQCILLRRISCVFLIFDCETCVPVTLSLVGPLTGACLGAFGCIHCIKHVQILAHLHVSCRAHVSLGKWIFGQLHPHVYLRPLLRIFVPRDTSCLDTHLKRVPDYLSILGDDFTLPDLQVRVLCKAHDTSAV